MSHLTKHATVPAIYTIFIDVQVVLNTCRCASVCIQPCVIIGVHPCVSIMLFIRREICVHYNAGPIPVPCQGIKLKVEWQ